MSREYEIPRGEMQETCSIYIVHITFPLPCPPFCSSSTATSSHVPLTWVSCFVVHDILFHPLFFPLNKSRQTASYPSNNSPKPHSLPFLLSPWIRLYNSDSLERSRWLDVLHKLDVVLKKSRILDVVHGSSDSRQRDWQLGSEEVTAEEEEN